MPLELAERTDREVLRFTRKRNPVERFASAFAIDSVDEESGTFAGYALLFGQPVETWITTFVQPGAFYDTIREDMARMKILYQHDHTRPIGLPTLLREDPRGLYFEARLVPTTDGKDARILMREKVLTEVSIGHTPVPGFEDFVVDEKTGEEQRIVRKTRVHEISPITWGAAATSITEANAVGAEPVTADRLARYVSSVVAVLREQHAGRVLSTANFSRIQQVISELQSLLDAATPQSDDTQADERIRESLTRLSELESYASDEGQLRRFAGVTT